MIFQSGPNDTCSLRSDYDDPVKRTAEQWLWLCYDSYLNWRGAISVQLQWRTAGSGAHGSRTEKLECEVQATYSNVNGAAYTNGGVYNSGAALPAITAAPTISAYDAIAYNAATQPLQACLTCALSPPTLCSLMHRPLRPLQRPFNTLTHRYPQRIPVARRPPPVKLICSLSRALQKSAVA